MTEGRLSRQTVAVAGPEETKLSEAVKRVARVAGKSPFYIRLPLWFHYAIGWLLERVMVEPLCLLMAAPIAPALVGLGGLVSYYLQDRPWQNNRFLVPILVTFRLALAEGGTRLEGMTWYHYRMWAATYWRWWSDAFIHKIQKRVVTHLQRKAESASDS